MKHAILISFVLTMLFCSCNRIKNKGQEITHRTERKIKSKVKDLIDQVFPFFEYDRADTKYNKIRFEEYLEIDLIPDVKQIYCYGDFFGADYVVRFSFSCDSTTIQRIILKKDFKLTLNNDDNGLLFLTEFNWWETEKTNKIMAYKNGIEHRYWNYLWYDKENKKAYYELYSL